VIHVPSSAQEGHVRYWGLGLGVVVTAEFAAFVAGIAAVFVETFLAGDVEFLAFVGVEAGADDFGTFVVAVAVSNTLKVENCV
jgi:hypothetical protein